MLRQIPLVSNAKQLPAVLVLGALLRLAIFAFVPLATLERRPETTSPLTSVRSLREGTFLLEHGADPYAGGVFHHSPLYLLFFSYAIPVSSSVLTALLWTLVDVVSALLLVKIWGTREARKDVRWIGRGHLVALLYLFNPYAVLSCVARSTTSIDNALVLAAIAGACTGRRAMSAISLALVTQTSIYPVILLLPLMLVSKRSAPAKSAAGAAASFAFIFLVVLAATGGLSTILLGPSWIKRSWGAIISLNDLTPNVGMWWYFFTEIFDHFRPFFTGVFQLHLLIYVAPLCLRLADPMHAVLILTGAMSTWKSYPTLGDMALWAGLLGCFPDVVANLRHPLFSLTVHLYTLLLLPLLHSLWLLTGTGNANFFYAATMVYGLNATLAIADVLSAIFVGDIKQRYAAVTGKPVAEVESLDVVQLASLS